MTKGKGAFRPPRLLHFPFVDFIVAVEVLAIRATLFDALLCALMVVEHSQDDVCLIGFDSLDDEDLHFVSLSLDDKDSITGP